MTAHSLKIFAVLVGLIAYHSQSASQSEGERLLLERRTESLRLTRIAADPVNPMIGTEAVIPDVDNLAQRYERTKAKLNPEYLSAYKPGPAHEVLRAMGCKVLGATPMGAPIDGRELHMEIIAYRCADGSQGTVTSSRNAPPDIRVEIDSESVTGKISSRPAVVRYFRAQQSRRLVSIQSWMAGPDYLVSLEQALPADALDVRGGAAWAKARQLAEALDLAYASRR